MFGIPVTFRIGPTGVATVKGSDLVRAKIEQLLGMMSGSSTQAGELEWDTTIGTGIDRARHMPNDAVMLEMVRYEISNAFRIWLPGISLLGVDARRSASAQGGVLNAVVVTVRYVEPDTGSEASVTAEL